MNVGIMGLLPEQVRMVQQEFPRHALRFLRSDDIGRAAEFVKGCDRIVLMTKFISHSMQDHVPPKKRVLIDGGITKLKSYLQTLPTPVKDVPVPQAKPAPTPAANAKPTSKFGSGPRDQQIDFSSLYNAKVGDVITLKRPAQVTLKQFDNRISATRSYVLKTYGVKTTTHKIGDGVATMKCVAKVAPKKPPQYSMGYRRDVEVATAPAPAVSLLGTATPALQPAPGPMQNALDARPAPPVLRDEAVAQFWREVFLERLRRSSEEVRVESVVSDADAAVRALLERTGRAVESVTR
jgi:hypothetical protein